MKQGQCAKCPLVAKQRYCCDPLHGVQPAFCASRLYADTIEEANKEYRDDTLSFAQDAAIQESECYRPVANGKNAPVKPRILEILEFCTKRGYTRIGLAFCIGLRTEAALLTELLEQRGFSVVSVVCKCGAVDKSYIHIKDEQKIRGGKVHESMCNPIAQAMILNREQVDYSLMLGLCVGHDSLFIKYLDSLCTVVAVKDRVLGHNPLAAIYQLDSYYAYINEEPTGEE